MTKSAAQEIVINPRARVTIMINYFVINVFFSFSVPANLVSFTFGVYTGWPATVSPLFESENTPLDAVLTKDSISWICSWGMLSAILGTFFWGPFANRYGRKATGFLTMVPYLISWLILLNFKTESALMVARFLGGLGASGAAINSPMYVSETSDAGMKDGLGSLFILMYNIGVLYVYVFGVYVSYDTLNLACLAVSVLFMFVWYCVPESPIYLIREGQTDKARESLKWCRGNREVEEELRSLTQRGDEMTPAKLGDYFRKGVVRALIIGLVFQLGTQLSGINIILMNTVDIFQKSGSTLQPEYCTMLVGMVQVIASAIAACTVNKAGRKFFLIITYSMTAVALITIGLCFYNYRPETDVDAAGGIDDSWQTHIIGLLPIVSLSLHVMAFSIGLGMIPYIIYAEIFPANVLNVCMSALMFWNNLLGFGVTKAYPYMTETFHISGVFWLYAVVCLLIVPYTYFFVPETKDKTYETIRASLLLWLPNQKNKNKFVVTQPPPAVANAAGNAVAASTERRVYVNRDPDCYAEP